MNNMVGINGVEVMPGSSPYVNESGVVRWNHLSRQLEVIGQNNWIPLNEGVTSIGLDVVSRAILEGLQEWHSEQKRIKDLCEQYPGLKDLKEKYEIMLALVQQENAKAK